MNLNPAEKKVLRFLADEYSEDAGCYAFAPIAQATKLKRNVVRLACRSMKRKGFTAFHIGLWTDDGDPRGSGYCATPIGRAYAEAHLTKQRDKVAA